MTAGAAPDYVEPVVGWRIWETTEVQGERLLSSIYHPVVWLTREPLIAFCAQTCTNSRLLRFFGHRPHSAPGMGCECGIYAVPTDRAGAELPAIVERLRNPVVGRVRLWGQVHEHEHGWRAELAYPDRLYVPVRQGRRSDAIEAAEELRSYGVPVEVLDVSIDAHDLFGDLLSGLRAARY